MAIYSYKNEEPSYDRSCFIAPSADIIGNVKMAQDVSIWFNSVVRGDIEPITIGRGSNIQDCSMLHTSEGYPLSIGEGVTVGHSVTLHSCKIEDNCLIGMGSIILDGAVVGKNSLVAAGSVIPPGKTYPPNSFIIGSPAIAKRELTTKELNSYGKHYKSYLNYKNGYLESPIRRID